MGIAMTAGFEYFLLNHTLYGGGYKNYENKKLLMLGNQHVLTTYREFFDICDNCKFELNVDESSIDIKLMKEKINSSIMFKWMGFSEVDILDISDYEGANIVFDLQNRNLPKELENKYDVIYNGGTFEHIFDVPTALINTGKMLAEDGIIIHDLPCNNYVDHGFYSFNPTWFLDYYNENAWYVPSIYFSTTSRLDNNYQQLLRSPDCRLLDCTKYLQNSIKGVLIVCIAQKKKESTVDLFPNQSFFEKTHQKHKRTKDFVANQKPKSVALYGTGPIAKNFLESICINNNDVLNNIACIYDSDKNKINTLFEISNEHLPIVDLYNKEDNRLDTVKTIILACVNKNIEIIYDRIKWAEDYGVEIIAMEDL